MKKRAQCSFFFYWCSINKTKNVIDVFLIIWNLGLKHAKNFEQKITRYFPEKESIISIISLLNRVAKELKNEHPCSHCCDEFFLKNVIYNIFNTLTYSFLRSFLKFFFFLRVFFDSIGKTIKYSFNIINYSFINKWCYI